MTRRFRIVDILYIIMMILPVCLGIAIKVLTTPPSDGITITGARIFFEIILPLSKSIIIYTILISFIAPWCDFIFVSYIMSGVPDTSKYTVALGMYRWLERESIQQYFTTFCAAAVVVATPITLLFMWLQKYYVEGVTGGAVKG